MPLKEETIKQTATQDLAAGALAFSYTMTHDGWLHWIGIHFTNASSSNTVIITFDSATGAAYDAVFESTVLSSADDHVFRPNTPIFLKEGDGIKVDIASSGTSVANLTAMFSEHESLKI